MDEENFTALSAIDIATISADPSVMRLLITPNVAGVKHEADCDDVYVLEFNENDPILMNSEMQQDAFTNDISIPITDDFQAYAKANLRTVMLPDGSQALLASDSLNSELLGINDNEITYVQNDVLNEQAIEDDIIFEINGLQSEEPPVLEDAEEELHGKKYACAYIGCDRKYTTKHHLRVHERVHTGERPYVCKMCERSFATSYSLKTHMRTHTGARPFECTFETCKKGFKTSGDLQKHIRTHTGERPFTCLVDGCDRSFTTSNIMKVHMRTHTGERPYACQYCDKKFSSTTNYRNHERIHTGLKPYICPVETCGKRFTEYSSLYKHQIVHVPSRQFRCDLCHRVFKMAQTLENHYLAAHSTSETAKNETEGLVLLPDMKIACNSENISFSTLTDSSMII